ncbi:MAG: hypothetical protein IKV22_02695 [Paludibacteraceae bacterium]|jgi:hypothetical protein|nr:hypothetical protein [Paludibacteraceae bacterium]
MANLFSRFSANIEQSQTVVEKQDNKALGALRNSLQVVKDSSEKAKAGIQSIDRTKVIEKTVALDYDKIIKAVSAAGMFLKAAKAISPSLVVLKDAALLYNQSEKELAEKETEYLKYLGTHIDVDFLYQTISPIVSSIPFGDQIISVLELIRNKKQE